MHAKLGRKISEGGCSEVFEWEDHRKIIKLAKPNTNRRALAREYDNNQIAWRSGLPVARPFEMVEIDGRPGIVLERIYGETAMERFVKAALTQPLCNGACQGAGDHENDIRAMARVSNEVHATHGGLVGNLPSQRDDIKGSILRVDYLTQAEKDAVIAILDSLPERQQLCHGDPNPGNFFVRDSKFVIIDWMNASRGNPEADLAEYVVMIRYAILPSSFPRRVVDYFNSVREWMVDVFMDEYTKQSHMGVGVVDAWITPIAARKLSADAISEEEKRVLVGEIRRRLKG